MAVPVWGLLPSMVKLRTTMSLLAPSIRNGLAAMSVFGPAARSVAPLPSNTRLWRLEMNRPPVQPVDAADLEVMTEPSGRLSRNDCRAAPALLAPDASMELGTATVRVVTGAANGRPAAGGGSGSERRRGRRRGAMSDQASSHWTGAGVGTGVGDWRRDRAGRARRPGRERLVASRREPPDCGGRRTRKW